VAVDYGDDIFISVSDSAAVCESPSEQYSYTAGADSLQTIIGVNGAYGTYAGQRLPASVPASYNICSIEFELYKQGSPNGSLYCRVYDDDSGSLDSVIATSDALACTSISTGTNVSELFFTGTNRIEITKDSVYHYILFVSGDSTYDVSNRLRLRYDSGGTPAANERMESSADGSTFTTYSDTGCYLVINGEAS
jgi:hypothetical protein